MANTDTITPEERAAWRKRVDGLRKELRSAYADGNNRVDALTEENARLLTALEAAKSRAEKAEDEGGKLREQVSALLELNEANMEFVVACIEEESAIADHDDSHAGRTPDTKLRLERVQASLVLAYDNVNNAREKCETLGLNVTPWRQGPRHA